MPICNPTLLRRITQRLLPFLLLMYILSFLDRANVGFAKAAFQADTGITDAAFAFGAGLFFIGYALLEVPSNLVMHRVGARIWMCRIMVTWGILSAAMIFAHDATTFYVLRFLLGVAEAGFFPGVILYLTYWFPSEARAKAMGLFYFGAPIALMLGGPLSGALLELDGVGGWHGWQWMFLVEGVLALLVGIWAFFYLDDGPERAAWLRPEEKRELKNVLDQEDAAKRSHSPRGLMTTLRDRRVLYLCLIYALIQASVYGVVFYLPTQVAALMGDRIGFLVGIVSAIPWLCALGAAYFIPRVSDHLRERRVIASLTLAAAGLGIAASAWFTSPVLALSALCIAAAGFIAVQPLFWTFPTSYLAGSAAAGGIALINALGALGGFAAPNLKHLADAAFGNDYAGLYSLAVLTLIGAVLIFELKRLGLTGMASSASTVSYSSQRMSPSNHQKAI